MHEVGRVVPALPVSLVASALLAGGEHGLSSLELKGAVFDLMRRLTAVGAHVHIPRHDQEYAVDVGLRMLMLRHLVSAEAGVYRRQPQGDRAARLLRQRHRPPAAGRGGGCDAAGRVGRNRRQPHCAASWRGPLNVERCNTLALLHPTHLAPCNGGRLRRSP